MASEPSETDRRQAEAAWQSEYPIDTDLHRIDQEAASDVKDGFIAGIRAGASPEAEPQHLGAGITDPLPPAVECCECGHPKQWHSKAGWCRMALDIGEECPCRCYAMKMTLLIGSRASSPAPTELDGADGVVGSEP